MLFFLAGTAVYGQRDEAALRTIQDSLIYNYAESLFDLADYYYEHKDYKHAKATCHRALDILDLQFNKTLYLYQDIYEELSYIAEKENDIYSAIHYMEDAVMVKHDTVEIVNDVDDRFSVYNELIACYANAGMWEKALRLQKKKANYWRILYENGEDGGPFVNIEYTYVMNYRRYIELLCLSNKHKWAIREIESMLQKGKYPEDYLNGIKIDCANCYFHLHEYHIALKYFEETQNSIGLAKTYASLGDVWRAIDIQKPIIEDYLKHNYVFINLEVSSNNGPYETYLSNLAHYYNLVEQYDSALVCESRHRKPTDYEWGISYHNMSKAFAGKRQWDKAHSYLEKAYGIYKQQQRSRERASVLVDLCDCSYQSRDFRNLEREIQNAMLSAQEDLLSTFQELTYDERSRFVEEYADLMYRKIPMYAYYTQSDTLVSTAYNATLMMKGAILSAENGVKRVIVESHDASLARLWDELRTNRYILSRRMKAGEAESRLKVDSLQKVINRMEDELVVRCKEYGDITRSMQLKWNNIQSRLGPKDIAIEFQSFPIEHDSVMYAALTLRKNSAGPKLTPLFEEKQLKEVSDTLYYQCKEMADLVWAPLQSELKGVKNIYFSPSGALYNIGVEYLPGMEPYNLYRLSSTRELVTKQDVHPTKNAVLYGGLDYYAGLDSVHTAKRLEVLDETFKERADVRGMGLRGGMEYLKHTKEEVDKIGEELKKAKWVCLLDTAAMGTEESFKSLSGRGIGCLHISTHGFYYSQDEAEEKQFNFIQTDDNVMSSEDRMLTRSGLIMSGANHILEGEELPDNVEDGILTAKEIAEVDLRNLDLVVLSACQTGLGDISQGEGVFGLQRGFKKAGARSILMSLWEVEDEPTHILMTQFYKHLLAGKSKRQALHAAQKYLCETENGRYNEPKYWAGFVLLDGM